METVYAVLGTCGEYSDRSEWVAACFRNHQDAKAFCGDAHAQSISLRSWKDSEGDGIRYTENNAARDEQLARLKDRALSKLLLPDDGETYVALQFDGARYFIEISELR